MTALPVPEIGLMTAEEFERVKDDSCRHELIDGVVHRLPFHRAESGLLISGLTAYPSKFVDEHDLGECTARVGVILSRDPDTVLGPDWTFIRKDRLPDPLPDGYLTVVPDIVLETRSPGGSDPEVMAKIDRWLNAGVAAVWDLNPKERSLTRHYYDAPANNKSRMRWTVRLSVEDTLTEDELLPGFHYPLRRLFR
jgi:Uma2 family endonuclease